MLTHLICVVLRERKFLKMSDNIFIVGAYEHPTRLATNKSVAQLHAEVAIGALEDAGLSKGDIDGFFFVLVMRLVLALYQSLNI